MIKKIEKEIYTASFIDVRAAFIARSRFESGRISGALQMMEREGFEQIDIPEGQLLTEDGREILHVHGKAWALQPEIHAKRLTEAMEQAKQRDAALAVKNAASRPQSHPATCTSLIDGHLCGGALAMAPVCPRCALGKMGVAVTLTCDVCGHVSAVMRSDA